MLLAAPVTNLVLGGIAFFALRDAATCARPTFMPNYSDEEGVSAKRSIASQSLPTVLAAISRGQYTPLLAGIEVRG